MPPAAVVAEGADPTLCRWPYVPSRGSRLTTMPRSSKVSSGKLMSPSSASGKHRRTNCREQARSRAAVSYNVDEQALISLGRACGALGRTSEERELSCDSRETNCEEMRRCKREWQSNA